MSSFGCCFLVILWVNVAVIKGQKPNIVFFLTDDQDVTLGGFSMMPKTHQLMVEQGLTFNNAFVHSPICCISRASILSGRYVHNHHTTNNSVSGNCAGPDWRQNTEQYCYAPYIRNEGYNTFYAGKYLNMYGFNGNGGTEYIPQGWSDWYALVGNSRYYGQTISNNGSSQVYGSQYITDYYTNVLREQALSFLDLQSKDKPFLLVVGTPAAHAPFIPAPQYNNTAAGLKSPRTPNWNNVEINKNKHQFMTLIEPMNATLQEECDQGWRYRLGSLKSVDDLVEAVFEKMEHMDLVDNTYFLYTSDHGFHLGQYGLMYDKRQLYEEDIRIPWVMRGPGIPKNKSTDIFALNVDIAPTFVDLATGKIPENMDGMSLVPYLNNTNNVDEQQFLIEYYGEVYDAETQLATCGGYPGEYQQICDMFNNSYNCVRGINQTNDEINGTIYCKFLCYDASHNQVSCDTNTVQGRGEYYNLDKDYYELNNTYDLLTNNSNTKYINELNKFMSCSGQIQCNQLRLGNKMKQYYQYIKDKLV